MEKITKKCGKRYNSNRKLLYMAGNMDMTRWCGRFTGIGILQQLWHFGGDHEQNWEVNFFQMRSQIDTLGSRYRLLIRESTINFAQIVFLQSSMAYDLNAFHNHN